MSVIMTNYVSQAVTLVRLAKELSEVDPIRNSYCIFCKKYVVSRNTLLFYHDEKCAWRIAREFFNGENDGKSSKTQ